MATILPIKTFLKNHDVKELDLFNGHSHLYESYLCEVKQAPGVNDNDVDKSESSSSDLLSNESEDEQQKWKNYVLLQAVKVKKNQKKKV